MNTASIPIMVCQILSFKRAVSAHCRIACAENGEAKETSSPQAWFLIESRKDIYIYIISP